MNILFLTTVLPGKKRGGGEIVSQQSIDSLIHNGHQVTILGYKPQSGDYRENFNEISIGERYIETETAKYYPLIWLLSSYIKGFPYSAQKYYSKAYLTKVTELLARSNYDIVTIDHAQLGWLQVLLGKTKLVFVSHNIEHELYLEQMQRTTNPILKKVYQRESKLIKAMEDRLASSADLVWTLTAHDAAYFANVTDKDRVKVLNVPIDEVILTDIVAERVSQKSRLSPPAPNSGGSGIESPPELGDLADAIALRLPQHWAGNPPISALHQAGGVRVIDRTFTPSETNYDLGLLGTWTWQPNQDGLKWFFESVYPHLPTTISIQVAGKGADWVQSYPNVRYCGFVPDARAFISQAKVMAIPVVGGGGIQIKTLEAISCGGSIVATPTALRGIVDYPASVSVASEPQDFAKRAIELISMPTIDQPRQSALAWSQQRRKDFDRDVGAAIGQIFGSKIG